MAKPSWCGYTTGYEGRSCPAFAVKKATEKHSNKIKKTNRKWSVATAREQAATLELDALALAEIGRKPCATGTSGLD